MDLQHYKALHTLLHEQPRSNSTTLDKQLDNMESIHKDGWKAIDTAILELYTQRTALSPSSLTNITQAQQKIVATRVALIQQVEEIQGPASSLLEKNCMRAMTLFLENISLERLLNNSYTLFKKRQFINALSIPSEEVQLDTCLSRTTSSIDAIFQLHNISCIESEENQVLDDVIRRKPTASSLPQRSFPLSLLSSFLPSSYVISDYETVQKITTISENVFLFRSMLHEELIGFISLSSKETPTRFFQEYQKFSTVTIETLLETSKDIKEPTVGHFALLAMVIHDIKNIMYYLDPIAGICTNSESSLLIQEHHKEWTILNWIHQFKESSNSINLHSAIKNVLEKPLETKAHPDDFVHALTQKIKKLSIKSLFIHFDDEKILLKAFINNHPIENNTKKKEELFSYFSKHILKTVNPLANIEFFLVFMLFTRTEKYNLLYRELSTGESFCALITYYKKILPEDLITNEEIEHLRTVIYTAYVPSFYSTGGFDSKAVNELHTQSTNQLKGLFFFSSLSTWLDNKKEWCLL